METNESFRLPEREIARMISGTDLENIINNQFKAGFSLGYQRAMEDQEPLTLEEAAKFLKVNVSTINRWMKSDTIPFTRLGSKPYFLKNELVEVLKQRKRSK